MSVDLFCPSRGRPDAARELQASFDATVRSPGTRLIFLVDTDDDTVRDYPGIVHLGAPTGDPTGPLNREALLSTAEIVGFIGDDSRCATKGWDTEVERALREPGFAYGPDDTGPAIWPSTAFVSRAIIEATGYFALPTLKRGFFDRQWISVARGAGIERALKSHFPHDNSEHPVAKEIIAADDLAFAVWARERAAIDTGIARHQFDLVHFFPAHVMA